MWTPKQLLNDDSLKTLIEAGFSDLKLEFLGWLSYTASAINNSRGPVKSAHTLLAKAQDPDENLFKMFALYTAKKKESVRPKERADHDQIDQEFDRLEKWVQGVEADAEQSREEEPLM